jgi:hypothetical protein
LAQGQADVPFPPPAVAPITDMAGSAGSICNCFVAVKASLKLAIESSTSLGQCCCVARQIVPVVFAAFQQQH